MAGPATNSVSTAVKQLSDGNSVGTALGQSTSDKIAFYTSSTTAPVAQPSGGAQAAITRGQQAGVIATIATTQSPSMVTANTSLESSMTLVSTTASFKVASGDLLYVNKPAAQAGLGLGNVRVSAANVLGVTFNNFTTSSLTPTASEKYAVVAIRGIPNTTQALTPAAVAASSVVEQQFTVPGLRAGELVQVMKPTAQTGLDIAGCRVVANNTLGITFANMTAATPITPTAAESYTIWTLGGLDAVSNTIRAQMQLSPTIATGASSAEQSFTCTNLAATDVVQAVVKPTGQAGLFIGGARASAANTLAINFGNASASTVTPTASEVYDVTIFRQNPAAPMTLFNAPLTPAVVAANTTAEQTFTVNGLIANTPVFVNKPSWQNGLGIVGCRASATNTLGITFCNSTASSITPTAGETYVIGNFQMPIPDPGATWLQPVVPAQAQASILANAIRSALTGTNLIAGA